ncbi:RHS repeat-associated core domain-containing protein, partial [Thalassoglobus neptunius]|uniref:RHS repeat-associated core domain-containing protein n=1 Tax=Thalassoglobus neptunius TaxID=1938619 RepID=UPI0011B821F9
VWGNRYIDECVLRDRDYNNNGTTLEERLYATQDANWNTTMLYKQSSGYKERYTYNPYGEITFLNSSFNPVGGSVHNWQHLFGSYRRDTTTELYLVRNRLYHTDLGTWLSRDPAGYEGGTSLYEYADSKPTISVDPAGLEGFHPEMFLQGSPNGSRPTPRPNEYQGPFGRTTACVPRYRNGEVVGSMGTFPARNRERPSSTRDLTIGERKMLDDVFGGNLNTDGLQVGKKPFLPWVKKNSMTPRYTPWFTQKNYRDDFSKSKIESQGHFIHEMTHVMQSQKGNWNFTDGPALLAKYGGNYGKSYDFNYNDLGKPLHTFNMEQQARIVEWNYMGIFTGEDLERCKRTLEGFHTQPPVEQSRNIPEGYSSWGQSYTPRTQVIPVGADPSRLTIPRSPRVFE